MTAGPPDEPDDDALDAAMAEAHLASRRRQAPEPGPVAAQADDEDDELPDALLGRLAARRGFASASPAAPPPTPPPPARPDVAPCFADLDVSALVDEHLEARTRRRRPGNPRVVAMRAMRGAERLAREADPQAVARAGGAAQADLAERLMASLAAAGEAPRLEAAAASLASGEVARKISGLAASIRQLVPPDVNLAAIAQDAAKDAVLNTLNPAVAASLAAADTAKRINALRGWATMPTRERVAHVAALSANMAELLGAFSPPPAGPAAQALGAGLGLVALAAEPRVGRRRGPAPAGPEAEAAEPAPAAPVDSLALGAEPAPPAASSVFRPTDGPPAARTAIPPRATGPLPPRGRTGALPPPPPGPRPGAAPPPRDGGPRAPGTGILQERRDNLAHNLGDRAQGAWARISKRLDEVKPMLDRLSAPPSDEDPPSPSP